MARLASILFVLAALVVIAVVLFGDGGEHDGAIDITDDDWSEEGKGPGLRTSGAADAGTRKAEPKPGDTKEPAQGPPRGRTRFIKGLVIDAQTRKPIAGASLHAEAHDGGPCERAAWMLSVAAGELRLPPVDPDIEVGPRLGSTATTDDEGRFEWWVGDVRLLADPVDVFASARGYVTSVQCDVKVGSEPTFELQKAAQVKVQVSDPHGRPVAGAKVMARPAVPGSLGSGLVAVSVTDENGRVTLDGLTPDTANKNGVVALHVDHPEWMPYTGEAFNPGESPEQRIELTPALRMSFKIRSDDGTAIVNPSLAWKTDGHPEQSGLLLLRVRPNGPESEPRAEVISAAVRIPCDHDNVGLEIKAQGFTSWVQKEPLPADGGEREVIVILPRDTSLGSLVISFQDKAGEAVAYTALGAAPLEVTHLGGLDIGAVTIEGGQDLAFQSLPAGRYLIVKRSPKYAPAEVEAEVRAGEKNTHTHKLGDPAKLRVRFTSDQPTTVQFRLIRGRRVLPAFPTSEIREVIDRPPQAPTGENPRATTGGDGALFTGLPSGACTIEVTSPNHVAAPRRVQLKEGETTEVEIEVRER